MELLSFVVAFVGFVFAAFLIVYKDSQETAAAVRANAAARRAASSRHAQPARHKDFLDVEGLSWPLTEEQELELKLQTARNARIRAAREAHAQKFR